MVELVELAMTTEPVPETHRSITLDETPRESATSVDGAVRGPLRKTARERGLQIDAGRDDRCDLKWNVASSWLITSDGFDSLPRCSQFALDDTADQPCLVLESPDEGSDYPLFWVIVSFEPV